MKLNSLFKWFFILYKIEIKIEIEIINYKL